MSEIENDFQVQLKPSSGKEDSVKLPEVVVIIPIMNSPIFPGMIAPIILSEEKYTPELDESLIKTGYVALNLVKNDLKDEAGTFIPEEDIDFDKKEIRKGDIYKVGVLCKVVKKLKLPDGSVNILVHGMKRYRASGFVSETPILKTHIEVFDDIIETDEELDAYTRSVINQVKKLSEINQ